MIGIAYTGSSLTTSLMSPIVTKLIAEFGWRSTYRILAASIVVVVLITALLVRTNPQDIGQKPYGTANKTAEEIKHTGFMRKDSMKKPWFWMYAVALFLLGLIVSGTSQQLVTYWTSEGVSAERAAALYSLVMLVGLVGKIVLGNVFDHFGISRSVIFCGIIAASAFITLALCLDNISLYVPALLYGIVTAELVIIPSFSTNRLFGRLDYPANQSMLTTILFLGSSLGITFCALVFDITGSYKMAWFIYAVIAVILTVLVFAADKMSIKAFRTELNIEREV